MSFINTGLSLSDINAENAPGLDVVPTNTVKIITNDAYVDTENRGCLRFSRSIVSDGTLQSFGVIAQYDF